MFRTGVTITLGLALLCGAHAIMAQTTSPSALVPSGTALIEVRTPANHLPNAAPAQDAMGSAVTFDAQGETLGTVIMLPGLGLDSRLFTQTPDGREGWAQIFAEAGYDVAVWNTPRLKVHAGDEDTPGRVWDAEQIWSRWGIGPRFREPFKDTLFPTQAFDAFVATLPALDRSAPEGGARGADGQSGRHVAGGADRGNRGNEAQDGERAGGGRSPGRAADPVEVANLRTLMEQMCPCITLAHSAAGSTIAPILSESPELFEALILLEPTGIPGDPNRLNLSEGSMPVLALYGDRLEERRQTRRYEQVSSFVQALGQSAEMVFLPDEGIYGNTHLFMVDTNSQELARRVIDWIDVR